MNPSISPPIPSHNEYPDWIRNADEFHKMPKERLQAPTQGVEVSPGKYQLLKDQIPEFIEDDLSTIKQNGRVLISKEVGELRVVAIPPNVQTSIDLDEQTSEIIVRPQYKSGSESIEHSELVHSDQARKYYRKKKTYHRVDWAQVQKVKKALKDTGLEEQADGSYRASSLSYDEIVNIFSKLGILSESEVFARFRQRLLGFTKIESLNLPDDLQTGVVVQDTQHYGYEWLAFPQTIWTSGSLGR